MAADVDLPALALKPDDHAASCNLGYVLLQVGRIDEAIKYLKEALRIASDMRQAQMNLNAALEMRDRKQY